MINRCYYYLEVVCCACVGFAVNAAPVISKCSLQFDFARIGAMSNSTNAMEIANTGDSPLEIHRVRACCGAAASISTNSIAPGAAATLTVALKPMAKPGPFRKKVTLYTNDPSAPVVEIPIVGEVMASKVEVLGNEVVVAVNAAENDSDEASGEGLRAESGRGDAQQSRLSVSLPVILLAGLVDGFNPCAFSIIIVLAGILAVGGRMRRARLAGGAGREQGVSPRKRPVGAGPMPGRHRTLWAL